MKDLRTLKLPGGYEANFDDNTSKVNFVVFYLFKDLLNLLEKEKLAAATYSGELTQVREKLLESQLKYLELLRSFNEKFGV